jgi:CRISPR-associated protein Cmr5
MRNLEQIRAAHALGTAERTTKAAVSKLPAMIMANGLLAAAAFASEKSKKDSNSPKRPDLKKAMDGLAEHLARPELHLAVLANATHTEALIQRLSASTSLDLQRATAEALAYLSYVKRFTTKAGQEEQGEE